MPDDYCELWAQGSTASELANVRRPEGLEWRAHGAKRSAQPRNTAQASAQGGAKMRNDHCELWIVYSPVHQLVQKDFFDKLRRFKHSALSAAGA